MILALILNLSVAAYVAAAWVVLLVLRRESITSAPVGDENLPTVTVVLAARDEEAHIADCVEALADQQYPQDRLQIVVVDDHSRDSTSEILKVIALQYPQLVVVDAAAIGEEPGKASALALGVERSSSELVATTDADCSPPAHWLRAMVSGIESERLAVLGGPTHISATDLFGRIQGLDWLLGFAATGAAATLGHPTTAMGNNMIFRRIDYDAVGGYRRFANSPTEDCALFRTLAKRPNSARLLLEPELATYTRPVDRVTRAFSQRRRWARGGLIGSRSTYLLYAVIWLATVLPVVALPIFPAYAMLLLALRILSDGMVIRGAARRLRLPIRWSEFPLFVLFQFAYVALVPVSLVFRPTIVWKGRRL